MDVSSTTLFESYEHDFDQFIDSIRDKLEGSGKVEAGEQLEATLRRVGMDLDEADEMVSQMELEMQGIPQSIRSTYHTRLRTAKSSLATHKKLLTDARAGLARAELLSSSKATSLGLRGSDEYSNSDDPYTSDRSRLLAGSNILEDGTKRLHDSHRIALETEDHGAEILRNLRGQREQIENARTTLWRADTTIDRASGTLKKMIRRMWQQRAVTYAIIGVLILLIVVIIWEKLSG